MSTSRDETLYGTDLANRIRHQEVAMIPTSSDQVVDVFRQYAKLYSLRNGNGGNLDAHQEKEWQEISFTLDSIFSGMYRPDPDEMSLQPVLTPEIRSQLSLDFLRVPTETDVLCETSNAFFSGRLQDISTGGAYVHASVPFQIDSKVKLTFCTFREEMPVELESRVAWHNPGGKFKNQFLEGAGVQFVDCDGNLRHQIEKFVYELVEETLVKANLL
jgi:uncharacterized protein (TIGR02266 family)